MSHMIDDAMQFFGALNKTYNGFKTQDPDLLAEPEVAGFINQHFGTQSYEQAQQIYQGYLQLQQQGKRPLKEHLREHFEKIFRGKNNE